MVAPIRYLSRRTQEQKIGILQNTEEEKVLEVVGRVGIGTTIFDAEYNLDVRGTANVSGILSVGQIISGAGNTFSDLTVTGDTDLQSDVIIGGGLTVTGVSTFASDVDINASVDISSNLTIAGVSTFQDTALFDDGTEAEPSISFINDTDLGLYRPADNEIAFTNGGSESVRIDSSGDVGIGTTNPSQKLDVNGNVNIRGELHGPEIFIIDPAAVGDNTGAVRIKGDLYVDGTEFIVDSENILLADYRVGIATTVATNLLLDGAGISIGATNIEKTFTYNNTANTLESSIGLGVTEGGEFKTGIDSVLDRTTLGPTVVNSSLTNLGTLTELNVSGFSTFSNTVDINATAEINTLNVSLLSNFSGDVDVNASLDIQDNLTVTGLSSFFSNVDITGNLDVDGHTELDDVNVSGVSTFAGAIDANSDLDVDGHTELDDLNVSGVSTFAGAADFNGDIDVDGHTELDNVNVSGVSTFAGAADFNGDIDVDGHTELDNVNVSGVSTFAGDISIADKITHIGDTDTAIRFPAADTFTVETAGVESLRVTSGAVGIGTDNPTQRLHVYGDANPSILVEDGSGTDQTFTRYKSSAHEWSIGADHQDGSFVINKSTNLRTGTPEVYINSFGNVGIATTLPSQTLDVNGDVRFRDKIFDSTGDAGVANYVLASGGPGSPWTWKVIADVGAGILDAIFVRQDGSDVGSGGTNTTLDFYENFSLTQPTAGIASVRLSDDINISGILTVGQLNINDTAGISTVISYDAVDQQRELQNIVIDCGTY